MDTLPLDEEPTPTANEPAGSEPSSANQAQQRQQRISQLRTESLSKPDALAANLGVFTVDMMEMAVPMKDAILKAIQSPAQSERLLRRSNAGLHMFLRLMGQVGRFANLEDRLSRKRGQESEQVPLARSGVVWSEAHCFVQDGMT